MPVVSINELKAQFEPGKKLSSEYFQNLVDTLADDRAAVHIGASSPEDPAAVPFWYNSSEKTLKLYDGYDWVLLIGSTAYSLPNEDGLPGQVLTTDGNGKVSWGDR